MSVRPTGALKRLTVDLREVKRHPLHRVCAAPLEDDIFTWHVNLLGADESPYEDAIIHIELKFPYNYPQKPPVARIISPISGLPHPHVHGDRICMDLLGGFNEHFADLDRVQRRKKKNVRKGQATNVVRRIPTGWTSAYSVRAILVQLQAFLMELDDVEDEKTLQSMLRRIPQAVIATEKFSCSICGHTPDCHYPAFPEPEECSSSDSPSGTAAFEESLVCFHSKRTYKDDTLGICIKVSRYPDNVIKAIDTRFDLLSHTSFYKDGVRIGVMQEKFTHWLPLYICKKHGERARELAKESISTIYTGKRDQFEPMQVLKILPALMNTMVVKLSNMRAHVSMRALDGYSALHRLLIMFALEYPSIVKHVNLTVRKFCEDEQYRIKKVVPNLGEFLPLLTISNVDWLTLAPSYLRESADRSVRWMLKKASENGAIERDEKVDKTRLETTFKACLVSHRILMYHVYFLKNFACSSMELAAVAKEYDQRLGLASASMRRNLQEAVRRILAVRTWEDFYGRIGLSCPPREKLLDFLVQAVKNSLRKGYHNPFRQSGRPSKTSYEPVVYQPGEKRRDYCQVFLQRGRCRYGSACRYLHVDRNSKGPRPTIRRDIKVDFPNSPVSSNSSVSPTHAKKIETQSRGINTKQKVPFSWSQMPDSIREPSAH